MLCCFREGEEKTRGCTNLFIYESQFCLLTILMDSQVSKSYVLNMIYLAVLDTVLRIPCSVSLSLSLIQIDRSAPANFQLTLRKTHPPLVTISMTEKQTHYTRSHAVKNISQSKEDTDNTPTEKTEQFTSDMKQGLRTLTF